MPPENNSKTAVTTLALIVAVVVLCFIGYFFFIRQSATTDTPTLNNGTDIFLPSPSGGAGTGVIDGAPVEDKDTISVATKNGALLVDNFLKDPTFLPGPESSYFVASVAAPGDEPITGTTTLDVILHADPEYQIIYFPADQSILVAILKEPIGEVRERATVDLVARLGISQSELCSLIAQVSVSQFVNEFYAGKSLGFPSCPGSVTLP